MTQEVVTQSHAVTCALDQSGDICHDKGLFLCHTHHAQHRGQGGEVIVGDLGLCGADHGDQRGFSHVGESYQSHVCQQFQLQCDIERLTGKARRCETRNLPGRGGEVDIALAASAALCQDLRLVRGEVCHDPAGLCLPDDRTTWHTDHQIRCALSGAVSRTAVFAPLGGVLSLIAEVDQCGKVIIHLKDHIAAFSAVAAVRAACRHILFPME